MSIQFINLGAFIFCMLGIQSLLQGSEFHLKGVDAVLQKNNTLHLFRFSSWTHTTIGALPVDSIHSPWRKLVRPSIRFIPRQVLKGSSSNYLVVEAGGEKIWQLDSAFQILSSLNIPEEFKGVNLDGYYLLYTQNQKFNFINTSRGQVLQFIEMTGQLKFHRKIILSMALEQCASASWPEGHSQTKYPIICVSTKGVTLFNLFFVPTTSMSRWEYQSLPLGTGYKASVPKFHFTGGSHILMQYTVGQRNYCHSTASGELFVCR